ncbi:MAG: acetyl-CoA hydrolase/transferase family protein [Panacagrimonas sp.]
MPIEQSVDEVLASLRPGMNVFVPGMSGESLALYAALKAKPEAAEGVRFLGAHFPGINRSDYLGLSPTACQRAYFMSPGLRSGLGDGRAELVPLDYPGIYRELSAREDIDVAFVQLTPPDEHGLCSLGVACDFQPAVWQRAKRRVAHINPRMPRTQGSFSVRYADLDAVFEADHELLSYDGGTPGESMRGHAALVASLVRDGDTLEFGVGKLQAGILAALTAHRDLKVWSGMTSTPVLALLDSGTISGRHSLNVGVALGDTALYERAARDEAFYFRPVSETHDVRRIAEIENFCAINSAVEVDLFGQVNADSLNGKLLAGVGGLPAFAAGALLSPGGRSIVALPSATDDGRFSRVVAKLGEPGVVALPRSAADYIVTENGIAALRGLSVHERAAALIRVAAPQFRESLSAAWAEIVRKL